MREVKAIKINVADFAPYGTFCNMTEPEGYPLQGEIVFPELVWEVLHFLQLQFAKMRGLSKQRNIIQRHGKEL